MNANFQNSVLNPPSTELVYVKSLEEKHNQIGRV